MLDWFVGVVVPVGVEWSFGNGFPQENVTTLPSALVAVSRQPFARRMNPRAKMLTEAATKCMLTRREDSENGDSRSKAREGIRGSRSPINQWHRRLI